ncbi:MAG: glycosyltransferase family 2 protein [Saprospiraceae bacterium]
MKPSLISVIIPTYNRQQFLVEAVESILNQTITDFELIIVNDGSFDDTEEWIKSQTDPRIQYIGYPKNKGVSYARNRGLEVAKGKYIAFADSDDLNEPNRFDEQIKLLELDEHLAICSSNCQYFGLRNTLLTFPENPLPYRLKAIFQTPFHFPACMVRRSFLEKENIRFRPEVRSADDYYFLMRVVAKGKAAVIPKTLYNYRWHESSISLKKTTEQADNELMISHLAFEEILNLKLSISEARIFYRFYRGQLDFEELAEMKHLLKKTLSLLKNKPNITRVEYKTLSDFCYQKLGRIYQGFIRKGMPIWPVFLDIDILRRTTPRAFWGLVFRTLIK